METVRFGKISSVNYEAGTVRVVYHEKDDCVTSEIPLLSFEYMMPEVDDAVLVLHLSNGAEAGVVLGAVAGDAALNMEVLSKVNEEDRKHCRELLEKKICKVELLDSPIVLHIIIEMYAGEDSVSLEIKYDHINVTKIVKNQEILLDTEGNGESGEVSDKGGTC